MECAQAREALSARLDGELTPTEAAALDAHLLECAACHRREDELQRLHQRLRVRAAEPVPDHSAAILAAHDATETSGSPSSIGGTAASSPSRRSRLAVAVAVAVALVVVSAGGALVLGTRSPDRVPSRIVALDAQATAAPAGGVAAVYVHVGNWGGDDAVVGARSAAAEQVSLHRTVEREGVLLMQHAPSLEVPGGGALVLEPGGAHVMLEGLVDALEPGDTITLELEFERSAPVRVEVAVVDVAEVAAGAGTAGD